MGLNDASNAERTHIAFFGARNAGKSSLVNAVCGQDLSVVSDIAGTTTDPVRKAMELLPVGPVLMIDTPGADDEGELGEMRIGRTLRVMDSADAGVIVMDATRGVTSTERELAVELAKRNVPYLAVISKCDAAERGAIDATRLAALDMGARAVVQTSSATGQGIHELKETLGKELTHAQEAAHPRQAIGDLLQPENNVVLVVPIDSSAPKGRIILPQQMVIREVLDSGALVHIARPSELCSLLESLKMPPKLVITDSQAFVEVVGIVSEEAPLTSFSILMARRKGTLDAQIAGAKELDNLREGSRVLLSEGCTHHRQCDDIGTVKIPRWIREHASCDVEFDFTSGGEFPDDLSKYQLVVHCGGCMLTEREMASRMRRASAQGVPCTNYGMAIAKMNGILERALKPLQ